MGLLSFPKHLDKFTTLTFTTFTFFSATFRLTWLQIRWVKPLVRNSENSWWSSRRIEKTPANGSYMEVRFYSQNCEFYLVWRLSSLLNFYRISDWFPYLPSIIHFTLVLWLDLVDQFPFQNYVVSSGVGNVCCSFLIYHYYIICKIVTGYPLMFYSVES